MSFLYFKHNLFLILSPQIHAHKPRHCYILEKDIKMNYCSSRFNISSCLVKVSVSKYIIYLCTSSFSSRMYMAGRNCVLSHCKMTKSAIKCFFSSSTYISNILIYLKSARNLFDVISLFRTLHLAF